MIKEVVALFQKPQGPVDTTRLLIYQAYSLFLIKMEHGPVNVKHPGESVTSCFGAGALQALFWWVILDDNYDTSVAATSASCTADKLQAEGVLPSEGVSLSHSAK